MDSAAVDGGADLVGLWDSALFAYGAMESSQLGLFADGTGWGVWSNFGGGMELSLVSWHCPDLGVLEIVHRELHSGRWAAGHLDQILVSNPPVLLNNSTRYRYELVRQQPPLGVEPVRTLTLDRPLQFASEYAFVRSEISPADVPTIVHVDG